MSTVHATKATTRKMTLEMAGLGFRGEDKIIVYNEIVPINLQELPNYFSGKCLRDPSSIIFY